MGLLDLLATRFPGLVAAKATPAPSSSSGRWRESEAESEKFTIPGGETVKRQTELYKKLSWVQIAIGAVAQTVATTPFSVKQLVGEDEKNIPNHAFELLLRKPNPLQSRFEFLYATAAWKRLTGNYYWWLNRASERDAPSELWIIPSHKIKPVPDGNLFLRGYLYDAGTGLQPITLEPWEVMHGFTFNPLSMFVGLSPIEALAVTATGDLKMQEWNTNFFGRDNAKMPGFLGFADAIGDGDWARMKAETKAEHGGTKRALMMLRGVGKGGVEWVNTGMSQTDMEFIAGRDHNKEEIWSLYAPGLASMLAINATEANSTSGRATFLELAVWPECVGLHEKVSNDLLPAYGLDLAGEFDDIRHTDRTLELEEQKAYERTHTIDESRKKYGGDAGIGDERGTLLVAEVPTARVTAHDTSAAVADQTALAKPPEPVAGEPAPGQPAVSPGEAAVATANKAADLDKWQRKATKALRQGKSPAVAFESEHLSYAESTSIETALADAGSEEAVKAAFALDLATADVRRRGNTPDLHDHAHERHPDPDAATKAADLTPAETALMDRLRAILTQHGKLAAASVINGSIPPLDTLSSDLSAAIQTALLQTVIEQATVLADTIGPSFDGTVLSNTASEWAATYTYDLVGGITDSTRTALQKAVASYQASPGMTKDDVVGRLAPVFGERRAETIAVTEITRAAAQGAAQYQSYLADAGVTMERVWNTSADDRQCAICGPMNRKPESEWGDKAIPAHPKCRCFVTLRSVKA